MLRFLGIGHRLDFTRSIADGAQVRGVVRFRTELVLQPVSHGGVRLRPEVKVSSYQMDAFVAVQLGRFEAARAALDDSTATTRIPRTS